MMNIERKRLSILSYIYIYIPIVIFLFGWTRWFIAVMCTLIILVGLIFFYKDTERDEGTKISVFTFTIVILFLLFVLYQAGIGRFTTQSGDWLKHNAIFADLTKGKWPVYYINGNEYSMLTYYIGQYLFPALCGKLVYSTSLREAVDCIRVTEIADYIWSAAGLLLVWLNLVRIFKIKRESIQYISAWVLCFFSGPLILAQHLLKLITNLNPDTGSYHWLYWDGDIALQYSNNFTLLRWTHPQTIAIWLIVLLFYENRDNLKYYVFMLLPGLLFGVLPFGGIVIMAVGYAVYLLADYIVKGRVLDFFRALVSQSNLLNAFSLGIVLVLYYLGNITGEKPDSVGFRAVVYGGFDKWAVYGVFVVFMVLIYAAVVFRRQNHNPLFYISVAILLVLPLFRMGLYNDLVMRGSIPALFVMMCFVLEYLNNLPVKDCVTGKIASTVLIVSLLFGFIHPTQELYDSIINDEVTEAGWGYGVDSLSGYASRSANVDDAMKYNYYSYDIETNPFFVFIARR